MTGTRRASRRPRILMITENVPLGADHRLRKQARTLLDREFDVTVICRRHPRNKICVPGVRVLQYPAPPEGTGLLAFAVEYGYSLAMAAVLTFWTLIRGGFDVLQVASTPDIYFLIAAPYRWLGHPVIFDLRDLSPETYEARGGSRSSAMYRILLVLECRSLRRADRVLVVNESLREIVRARGGVDDARIALVGNGPWSERITRRPPCPGLRPEGRRYLACWVGMIGPQDRADLALRAIAHLVLERKRTDCSLVFVGTGEELPALRRLAAELGISDWVSFSGWVEEDAVFDYLGTADLAIESTCEEYVSGVKVMEYLAAGLPVVAFEAAETVRLAGDAARYAPKGDEAEMSRLIDELLTDQAARQEMGHEGQRRAKEYIAWEHQAVRYITAINELIKPADAHERDPE